MDVRNISDIAPVAEHNGTTPVWYMFPPGTMRDITKGGVFSGDNIREKRGVAKSVVAESVSVSKERIAADSVVEVAGVVIIKRLKTDGCVIHIIGAVKERPGTDGRILDASPIVIERVPSDGSVIVGIGEQKRSISNTGVSVATCIGEKCAKPSGYVVVASGIVIKRLGTVGRALIAADIAEKRSIAGRRVLVANGVAMECLETNGHIPDSGGEAEERVSPLRGVVASIASVRWRANRSRCR